MAKSIQWHGVRTIYWDRHKKAYEERVTVWRAKSFKAAYKLAKREAKHYARDVDVKFLGLFQTYHMADQLEHGAEVFSLVRVSKLPPQKYLDRFFDTGAEVQGRS